MDNEYNYGNNEEKREEPARIEPPVPEDGIIEEAAQTEQRQSRRIHHTMKNRRYMNLPHKSPRHVILSRMILSHTILRHMVRRHMNSQMRSQRSRPSRHMRKEKERKPIHIGVKWATCICMALVFGLLASAAFQASNLVINKVVGNKTTVASSGQKVNSTKVSTNTSSDVDSDLADMVENVMPSVVSINKFKCTAGTGFLWRCS